MPHKIHYDEGMRHGLSAGWYWRNQQPRPMARKDAVIEVVQFAVHSSGSGHYLPT